ncbi:MAG: T9SS type A sorting domain-containing protein, partial [Bacteroidales bacterium]|nr:T9SS type A sorting domain-containing protein [Bacteroidales bacterium]
QAGNYAVTLTSGNLNGEAELTKFDMIQAGGYQPWFNESFENGDIAQNQWTIENPDDGISWELREVSGNGGNFAASVNFQEYLIGKRDRLISAPFNLSEMSTAWLEFQHAYAKKYDTLTDSLVVLVSADCGENWTRVFAAGEDGSGNFATHEQTDNFYPQTGSDWCGGGWGASCISVDLGEWAGQANIRVAFESYSAIGNPLFIDNISISQYVDIEDAVDVARDMVVFPNPTSGAFNVMLPEKGNFNTLQLVSPMGAVVYELALNGKSRLIKINTENKLSAGIWLLRVNAEGQSLTKKVLVY